MESGNDGSERLCVTLVSDMDHDVAEAPAPPVLLKLLAYVSNRSDKDDWQFSDHAGGHAEPMRCLFRGETRSFVQSARMTSSASRIRSMRIPTGSSAMLVD